MNIYNEEIYGAIEWSGTRARGLIIFASLFYSVLSIVLLCLAVQAGYLYAGFSLLFVLFFLWRIYAIHLPVVLVTESVLLVMPSGVAGDFLSHLFEARYVPVEYEAVAGTSDSMNRLYIGTRSEGGLVSLPVRLNWMSAADKKVLLEWMEKKQQG